VNLHLFVKKKSRVSSVSLLYFILFNFLSLAKCQFSQIKKNERKKRNRKDLENGTFMVCNALFNILFFYFDFPNVVFLNVFGNELMKI
jgi:hypothetical protein